MRLCNPFAWLDLKISTMTSKRMAALLVLCGILSVGALPPYYLWPLSFLAYPVLFLSLRHAVSRKQGFLRGWLFGCGQFGAGLYWLVFAFLVDADQFAWLIPVALPLLAAGMGLFIGLFGLLVRLLWRGQATGQSYWQGVFVFAACWSLVEWLRTWIFTGFPWNMVATTWMAWDEMTQSAALWGALGLGMVSILAFTLPAAAAHGGRKGWFSLGGSIVLLALLWWGGTLRLNNAEVSYFEGVRLRLVQANIPQKDKWDPRLRVANFQDQLQLSLSPSPTIKPTHVIWPETAATFSLTYEPSVIDALASIAPDGGAAIVGFPRTTGPKERPYKVWNSLAVVGSDKQILGLYDKTHLVPFGEYVPLSDWLPIKKITHGSTGFTPGAGITTLAVPGLPAFSPLICYEVIFPGAVRQDPSQDQHPAQWLLNLTNDAWYGDSAGPYQHVASARFRAIEEGLSLVRAANTGISLSTDPYGRVEGKINLLERGVLDVNLAKPLDYTTPYTRFGGYLLAVMMGVFLAVGSLPIKRGP